MADIRTPTCAEQRDERLSPEMKAHLFEVIGETRAQSATVAAKSVDFLSETRLLVFQLTNGSRLAVPVEEIEDFAHASDDQLAHFHLEGGGRSIHFPDFDGNVHIPTLVNEARSSRKWMQGLEESGTEALKTAA